MLDICLLRLYVKKFALGLRIVLQSRVNESVRNLADGV